MEDMTSGIMNSSQAQPCALLMDLPHRTRGQHDRLGDLASAYVPSDAETEDYFGSSESSAQNTNTRNTLEQSGDPFRSDSVTHQWPFHRFVPAAPLPKPAAIHPVFRSEAPRHNNSSTIMGTPMWEQRDSRVPRPNRFHGPNSRDDSINSSSEALLSPTGTTISLPPRPKTSPDTRRSIFRFGNYGARHAESSPTLSRPAQTPQRSSKRLSNIRQAVSKRFRQLSRTKRTREDADDEDRQEVETARPSKHPRVHYHCQTCQCHARVEASLLQHRAPLPPIGRPRPTVPGTPAPRTSSMPIPAPTEARWLQSGTEYRALPNCSVPYLNYAALSSLEGRLPRCPNPVPSVLEGRRSGNWSVEDVALLQRMIRLAEPEPEDGEEEGGDECLRGPVDGEEWV